MLGSTSIKAFMITVYSFSTKAKSYIFKNTFFAFYLAQTPTLNNPKFADKNTCAKIAELDIQ